MAIYAIALNFIFGRLFGATTQQFVPWVTCGIVAWHLITGVIGEASNIFIAFRGYILQSDRTLLVYPAYSIARHLIIFMHHLLAAIGVLIYFGELRILAIPLMLLHLPLAIYTIGWVVLVIALVATRYRDVPPIIGNILQVAFFVTPIMFMPNMLPDLQPWLMLNPFAQIIDLIREPLLGRQPSQFTLAYCALAGTVGWGFALMLYNRARGRIAYWL